MRCIHLFNHAWRRAGFGAVLALAITASGAALAVPQPPANDIDETEGGTFPFGTYDQNSPLITACSNAAGSEACGPVASINSMVYLQNRFSLQYATPGPLLVPDTSAKGINALATSLAQSMNCNCTTGTTPGGLAAGLMTYFATAAPNAPTDIVQVANPSIDFLMNELYHGEDVELRIAEFVKDTNGKFVESRGHWITATGAATTDVNKNGFFDQGDTPLSLSFVDPGGDASSLTSGQVVSGQALGTTNAVGGNLLQLTAFDWGQPPSPPGAITVIMDAVSESPRDRVPEPSALGVLASGLFGLSLYRRRTRRR